MNQAFSLIQTVKMPPSLQASDCDSLAQTETADLYGLVKVRQRHEGET